MLNVHRPRYELRYLLLNDPEKAVISEHFYNEAEMEERARNLPYVRSIAPGSVEKYSIQYRRIGGKRGVITAGQTSE